MPKIRSKTRTTVSQAPERSPDGEETSKNQKAVLASDIDSLSGHAAIFGECIKRKNTVTAHLLHSLKASGTPFLLIEPSKRNYRHLLQQKSSGNQAESQEPEEEKPRFPTYEVGEHNAFAINPLEIMPGVRLDSHVSRLTEIFRQLFHLDQPATLILELALEIAYERRGWNMVSGANSRLGDGDGDGYEPELQPTLSDVIETIDEAATMSSVDQSLISPTVTVLKSSIKRLLSGNRGCLFGVRTKVSANSLFQASAILELNSLPGDRERAFLIALIFCFLQESASLKADAGDRSEKPHHVLVFADSKELEPAFSYLEAAAESQTLKSNSFLARHLKACQAVGESVIFVGATAEQLGSHNIKKLGVSILTKESNLEELRQLAEWLNADNNGLQVVANMAASEAMIFSATKPEPSTVEIDSLKPVDSEIRNGDAQDETGEEHPESLSSPSHRELLQPFISAGAAYAPEAFHLETYLLGKKVAESPAFREIFVRYILSVLIDMTQLVHFRPRIMQEVHAVAGRKHKLPNHLVCWCALSLVVDRYFADKAVEYDWTMADLRKVKDVWYKMMAPAFLPSIPNRKLDAGIIRSWIADFTALHKKDNLPMPACGQCTNKCQFRYDVAACLDDEDRHAFKDLLSREEQAEAVAWLGKVICERLAGRFDLNLAYCVATSLVFEQEISKDAQLLFMHNVREQLGKEVGNQSHSSPRR